MSKFLASFWLSGPAGSGYGNQALKRRPTLAEVRDLEQRLREEYGVPTVVILHVDELAVDERSMS